jgi:multidrug resistance efflux pump
MRRMCMTFTGRPRFKACLIALLASVLWPVPATVAQERNTTPRAEPRGDGVYDAVDGQTTITFLKPVGSRVKKGELVCELESFGVRTKMANQEAAVTAALGPYEDAKRARESAELAITEYLQVIYAPQLKVIEQEISLAGLALKREEDSLVTVKHLYEKGLGPKSYVDAAELKVQRARLALEKTQGKKDTLQKFTKEKKVKELQSKVERARAQELARQADYGREQAVQDQLKKQLERCKLLAPADGRVSYPENIEEGAEVSQGQLVFRVVPDAESKPAN